MGRQLIIIIFLVWGNMVFGQPGTVKISNNKIEQAVRQYVENQISPTVKKFSVENFRIPNLFVRTDGDVAITVERNRRTPLKGLSSFQVKISDGQRILKTVSVTARVRVWEFVLLANQIIRKDEKLIPDMFRRVVMETTKLSAGYVQKLSQTEGKKARRTIRKGDILYSRFMANVPIIFKGEQVSLVYARNNIRITVQAKALSEGAPGDVIWVKNLQSGKRLKARVSQKGVVTLE